HSCWLAAQEARNAGRRSLCPDLTRDALCRIMRVGISDSFSSSTTCVSPSPTSFARSLIISRIPLGPARDRCSSCEPRSKQPRPLSAGAVFLLGPVFSRRSYAEDQHTQLSNRDALHVSRDQSNDCAEFDPRASADLARRACASHE